MRYTRLGERGPRVSRIAFGNWSAGGDWGRVDRDAAIAATREALDLGVTLFDTARAYGFGAAERLLGEALRPEIQAARDAIVIATKGGLRKSDGETVRDSSPAALRSDLEASLKVLGTEYVDIYQVHWPDESVPFEETARTLDAFRREEKIRSIGVSNFSPAQMDRFRKGAPLNTIQPPYNLFEREIEKDVLSYAERNGLVALAYGALCRGLLTGKITAKTEFKGDDLRKVDPKFQQPRLGHYLAAVARLDAFARERYGKTVLALAVRWLLDRGKIVALWGARRPDQLEPVKDVMGWTLDGSAMREIDRILAETIKDEVGPEFMAPQPSRTA